VTAFTVPSKKFGWLDFTMIGGQNRRRTEAFFAEKKVKID
jgi:hypothetical protein